jgi:dTDP-glucose 4,6-dehydratase
MPAEDLERCHALLGLSTWRLLAGQRVFIAGGTGFIGKWLLATLLDANEAFGLDCQITVLSRDPVAFMRAWPAMVGRITWIAGDVRDFPIPQARYDTVIHAATDVVAQTSPQTTFSTCVDGTRRMLDLARACEAQQFLLISSGAVYGPLPIGMTHVPETHFGGPDPLLPDSAVAEWLTAQAAGDIAAVKIARVFALIGPHLPLDRHFAIGNFLRAAMADEALVIQGDGTPYRSFLHAADMAAWLWAVLLRGRCGVAYNVGSDEGLSIADLARKVCQVLNRTPRLTVMQRASPETWAPRYVPDIARARRELNLPAPLPLDEAIARTARWHRDLAV